MHKTAYQLMSPGSYIFTTGGALRCDAGEEPVIVVADVYGYTLDDILRRVIAHEQDAHQVRH